MVSELCLKYKCKECPEQVKCYGCEHNYILIKKKQQVIYINVQNVETN